MQNDITPIICIGHEIEGEDLGAIVDEIQRFTAELPAGVQPWVALEPQWAITYDGKTNAANTDFIQTAVERVKQMTINGQNPKVLYGGSVNSSNINELNQIPKLDGYLIGTASYDWEEMKSIL